MPSSTEKRYLELSEHERLGVRGCGLLSSAGGLGMSKYPVGLNAQGTVQTCPRPPVCGLADYESEGYELSSSSAHV